MELKIYVSTIIRSDDKILLVKEAKEINFQKWNLPGGSLEPEETIFEGAKREVLEETFLTVKLVSFLGVYKRQSLRFVFIGELVEEGQPQAGDEILETKWFSQDEIFQLADEFFVSPVIFRKMVSDYYEGIYYPLTTIFEVNNGEFA